MFEMLPASMLWDLSLRWSLRQAVSIPLTSGGKMMAVLSICTPVTHTVSLWLHPSLACFPRAPLFWGVTGQGSRKAVKLPTLQCGCSGILTPSPVPGPPPPVGCIHLHVILIKNRCTQPSFLSGLALHGTQSSVFPCGRLTSTTG